MLNNDASRISSALRSCEGNRIAAAVSVGLILLARSGLLGHESRSCSSRERSPKTRYARMGHAYQTFPDSILFLTAFLIRQRRELKSFAVSRLRDPAVPGLGSAGRSMYRLIGKSATNWLGLRLLSRYWCTYTRIIVSVRLV